MVASVVALDMDTCWPPGTEEMLMTGVETRVRLMADWATGELSIPVLMASALMVVSLVIRKGAV